jgi:hypothetical protein
VLVSPQLCFKKKRGMGYRKKIWTHEGPSIEKKNRKKKYGHMKVHEKKRKKKKEIAMPSKEFI